MFPFVKTQGKLGFDFFSILGKSLTRFSGVLRHNTTTVSVEVDLELCPGSLQNLIPGISFSACSMGWTAVQGLRQEPLEVTFSF